MRQKCCRKCSCSYIFSYLSSSQKFWLLLLTCPICTSADLEFPGNIFHPQAYTTFFHWQWEKGPRAYAKDTDGKRVKSGFSSEPWIIAGGAGQQGKALSWQTHSTWVGLWQESFQSWEEHERDYEVPSNSCTGRNGDPNKWQMIFCSIRHFQIPLCP